MPSSAPSRHYVPLRHRPMRCIKTEAWGEGNGAVNKTDVAYPRERDEVSSRWRRTGKAHPWRLKVFTSVDEAIRGIRASRFDSLSG
ncbi:sugar ABC transporter substrate-binding protein [Sesbania bispinosa]|nr:sugar ABC transporter substrate-binding protein [Sesbania bispinosa]